VLFDVLHHVIDPLALFREARRTLRPGGRMVLMEPYVSLCSYPILRYFHPEDVDSSVDPLSAPPAQLDSHAKDPFAGNQASPGLIFGRFRARFEAELPELRIVKTELYSGLSYVASGGFSHRSVLPHPLWAGLFWIDRHIPRPLRPLLAFRFLIVLERT
jgi:SAM-dependent methyltransferase